MDGPYLSEKLVFVALGYFKDPGYRADQVEAMEERASITALKAGLELYGDFDSLKDTGFNPFAAKP